MRRTSARQAPHDSRPALMSCAIEPACFVSGDSPASDLPHEVHRIWNHFSSASVYQKTPTQKRGCRIFLSVAKEKGEYLDQPRIRRICVIASLLDVITSRHEAKFVD